MKAGNPSSWVATVRAASEHAYGGGWAHGWCARVEVDGALVDGWIAGSGLLRPPAASHPLLWFAVQMTATRLVRVRGLIPDVAPASLRPASRLLSRVAQSSPRLGSAIFWGIEHGVRLRYGEVVALVPGLRARDGTPVAALPRLWTSLRWTAAQDAAVLGVDARHVGVRVRVSEAGAHARAHRRPLLGLERRRDGDDDPLLDLAGHALQPIGTHDRCFALAISPDAAREPARARLTVAAHALPGLPPLDVDAPASAVAYGWVAVGPHARPRDVVHDPGMRGSLLGDLSGSTDR